MRGKITKRLVDSIGPGTRDVFVWDNDLAGFGLKVTPGGAKVYIVQYRMGGRETPTRRATLGKHGVLTPDQARSEAARLLADVTKGIDPVAARKAAEDAARREREEAERRAKRTFAVVADLFIERHARPNARSWAEMQRILNREVMPLWAERDIAGITRRDIIDILDATADRGAPHLASKLLDVLRSLFGFAVDREIIQLNPATGVKPPIDKVARDRVLSESELVAVWRAAEQLGYPFGPVVQMLILTGQRRDEVAGMTWAELDLGAATWTIPKERAKNGLSHLVHLSETAIIILNRVPRTGEFVFTTTGTSPVSGFSKVKQRLDGMILAAVRKAAEDGGDDPATVEPMPGWTLHDLRRTMTTGLASIGVAPHVADKILNHKSGTIKGVAAVYNRAEYLPERRAALEAWGRRLDGLLNGVPSNVVPPRGTAKAAAG